MSSPFYAPTCCQDPNCLTCAVSRDEIGQVMVDFLAIMLDGKKQIGNLRVIAEKDRFSGFQSVGELAKVA